MSIPRITIAVVPRERFSFAAQSLRSLIDNTDVPFSLVYVDGRSPASVSRFVRQQCESRGYQYLRFEHYLSPNEARNIALRHVETEFVVFVDNDLFVNPGWLGTLLRCADETGAWLAGPLYLEGGAVSPRVHMAGGYARIETRGGGRHLVEGHFHPHKKRSEIPEPLERTQTQLLEFHCMLARAERLRQLGDLDERLLSMHEHVDVCLTVRAAGGTILFEPASVVRYSFDGPLRPADLPYIALRWSDDWNSRSIEAFKQKWALSEDDPSIAAGNRYGRRHRQMLLEQIMPARLRKTRFGPRIVDFLDRAGLRSAAVRRPRESSSQTRPMKPVDDRAVLVQVEG